jgi:hypothetical protein
MRGVEMSRTDLQVIMSPDVSRCVEEVLTDVPDIGAVSHDCPHCGLPVRYPLMVKQEYAETFQLMIDAAAKYLKKTGVTAAMLADIRAQCFIAIGRRAPGQMNKPTP